MSQIFTVSTKSECRRCLPSQPSQNVADFYRLNQVRSRRFLPSQPSQNVEDFYLLYQVRSRRFLPSQLSQHVEDFYRLNQVRSRRFLPSQPSQHVEDFYRLNQVRSRRFLPSQSSQNVEDFYLPNQVRKLLYVLSVCSVGIIYEFLQVPKIKDTSIPSTLKRFAQAFKYGFVNLHILSKNATKETTKCIDALVKHQAGLNTMYLAEPRLDLLWELHFLCPLWAQCCPHPGLQERHWSTCHLSRLAKWKT
ncbi:hypothetical protein BgiMline_023294 [Biomphalaria glabrata]